MKTKTSMTIDETLIEDVNSIVAIMPEFNNRSAFFEKAGYAQLQLIKDMESEKRERAALQRMAEDEEYQQEVLDSLDNQVDW